MVNYTVIKNDLNDSATQVFGLSQENILLKSIAHSVENIRRK